MSERDETHHREDNRRSGESSEAMLDLLKELALLKGLDAESERGDGSDLAISEIELRKKRRREITDQIMALGGEDK